MSDSSNSNGQNDSGNNPLLLIAAIVIVGIVIYFLWQALAPSTESPSTLLK